VTAFLVRVLRAASIAICLIAVASFLLFAVNQTSTASGHQQEELGAKPAVTQSSGKGASHEGSVRRSLDEVTETLTSPAGGLSSSEWGDRGLRLLFALIVYGFALGFLARTLRVRA
jgi:hypothetical protein